MANRSDSSVSPSASTPSALAGLFVHAIATAVFSLPTWAWRRVHTVVTHNGVFHADDVVGYALLRAAGRGRMEKMILRRTRNQADIDDAEISFDVGEGQYDHHGSRAGLDPCGVPWSGLSRMWWDGLCSALLPGDQWAQGWFYSHVVAPISWQDNGKELPEGFSHPFQWVASMNPVWDETDGFDDDGDRFDTHFRKATLAADPMVEALLDQARAFSRGRKILENLPDDYVVVIPAGIPDWGDFLAKRAAKFVVFQGTTDTPWYAQCVPTEDGGRFSKKVPFPKDWAGRRGDDLSSVSGVAGSIFCHVGQFISGWKTKDDALFACEKALNYKEP